VRNDQAEVDCAADEARPPVDSAQGHQDEVESHNDAQGAVESVDEGPACSKRVALSVDAAFSDQCSAKR